MSKDRLFQLTEEHIKLLREMYVDMNEEGTPYVDFKRPYGSSDPLWPQVCEILNWTPALIKGGEKIWSDDQEGKAERIHRETPFALQIVLVTGEFKPGTYMAGPYDKKWEMVP